MKGSGQTVTIVVRIMCTVHRPEAKTRFLCVVVGFVLFIFSTRSSGPSIVPGTKIDNAGM